MSNSAVSRVICRFSDTAQSTLPKCGKFYRGEQIIRYCVPHDDSVKKVEILLHLIV
jgi:hypothetical protein